MNKLGVYFAYWTKDWNADFKYYVDKVSMLGFDVLEISTAFIIDESKKNLTELRKFAEDKNIELTYCIGFPEDKDLASEDYSVRRNGIEYAKKTLEVIHFMQGNIFGGINYSSWPKDPGFGIIDKRPYLERSINCLKELAKTAEDYGIIYCLEVVNRFEQFLINTAKEGVEFINEIDSPNVKLLLDTFHMNIEEDHIGKAIEATADKIGHFHIGECNRKVPGKGHMPWDEIIKSIHAVNYKGRIVMEPFTKMGGQVGYDIKVWRDLSGGADEVNMDIEIKNSLEFLKEKIKESDLCNQKKIF